MATNDKYDRQLRLWGSHGQRKLGQGKCIMLGTSSAGSETLKNLVLPGFGNITIVDDKLVEQRDLGNDFFVTNEHVGQPKAQVTLDLLLEMNPDDVQGNASIMSAQAYISSNQEAIQNAQLVIACDLDESTEAALCDLCSPRNIPLVVMRQYGLIGYLRVSKPINYIIEPKMAQVKFRDLRVAQPWPELKAFADSFDMETIEEIKYVHVPYAVVLIKACDAWRAAHDGQMPANFAQKQEFKAAIKASCRFVVAENFDEAINAALECHKKNEVLPDNITHIFTTYQDLINTSKEPFWIMVRALKQFVDDEGRLPVQGDIPDMISMPDYYLALQKIYLAKSDADAGVLRAHVDRYASEAGVDKIAPEMLTRFVRNCLQIQVLKMNTIRQEQESPDWFDDVQCELMDPSNTCAKWFIAIKAFEKAALKSADPTKFSDDEAKVEADLALLKEEAKAITDVIGCESELDVRYLKEMLRYGRSKLHCVSSMLGGTAAQEACKLVMSQYLPMNHTFIYDGVNGSANVFNL